MSRRTQYEFSPKHSPDERSPTRDEDTRTNIPVSLRDFRRTSSEAGYFGHWTFRSRSLNRDEQSDSGNSEDQEAAELSDDEGFWNMSRRADASQLESPQPEPAQSLTNLARGVLGDITTTAMNRLPNFSGTQQRDLVFDDENVVIIFDVDEEREQEVPRFDFDVPIGPRVHESYRFEIEHPTVAPAIRYLYGIPTARHLAALGRGIHHHSMVGFNNLTYAYGRVTETYVAAAENIQPALRITREVAADVAEGARVFRDIAQEQWREWSPWLDRMFEATATGPARQRRGSLMR
ncbi:unnamed protein product [Clonostachys rosea]|uniref:Uncharacterized protein n=1 Tax=Bionectria ochroleuca TaxID=29856 RepID=A0ABY6U532_BIOOC|nr:unnamed protein product [Clonostachys rosea]